MKKAPRVAIVYDWIDSWGGVERVLLNLIEMFPNATLFTSYTNLEKAPWAKNLLIKSSFIERLPRFIKNNRVRSVPFYPFAFESFDFSEFDLVLSVTSSFAKGIVTRPETHHICYLLTPTRFLWLYDNKHSPSGVFKIITKPLFNHLLSWDRIAARRPDTIISISKTVQKRTKEIYSRDSEVIYPPFDVEYWGKIKLEIRNSKFLPAGRQGETNSKFKSLNSKFYLVVSRLEPYKRVDLTVNVFNQLPDKSLLVVGRGSQLEKLRARTRTNITFLQDISDSDLAYLYTNAHALIMPQEEDFGLVSLEAQFFGCPVVAYGVGGATETIVENETGLFFKEQTTVCLQNALLKYDTIASSFKKKTLEKGPKQAEKFSKDKFVKQFMSSLDV